MLRLPNTCLACCLLYDVCALILLFVQEMICDLLLLDNQDILKEHCNKPIPSNCTIRKTDNLKEQIEVLHIHVFIKLLEEFTRLFPDY